LKTARAIPFIKKRRELQPNDYKILRPDRPEETEMDYLLRPTISHPTITPSCSTIIGKHISTVYITVSDNSHYLYSLLWLRQYNDNHHHHEKKKTRPPPERVKLKGALPPRSMRVRPLAL
jgi:hypothetical protein